jgi:hypothetical protein
MYIYIYMYAYLFISFIYLCEVLIQTNMKMSKFLSLNESDFSLFVYLIRINEFNLKFYNLHIKLDID